MSSEDENKSEKSSESEEGILCNSCGENTETNYSVSWQCMDTNQILYMCLHCLEYTINKPEFFYQDYSELFSRNVVMAKTDSGTWQRAMVQKFDRKNKQCKIEFLDQSPSQTQVVSLDHIKQIFTFDNWGNKIPLEKKPTFSEYMGQYDEYGNVPFIRTLDGLIPEELTNSLNKNLAKIADAPKKDFHPGSDKKVQNLVHPSLFCYVCGVSILKNGTIEEFDDDRAAVNFFGRINTISQYQWLPTNFYVNEDRSVEVKGYINGLTPKEQFIDVYRDIEKVFGCFLPVFKELLQDLEIDSSLRGRSLQVFVKAANYILQPGQIYEGVWHVEGLAQEHIIATGIYYYDVSDNMEDSGLSFRRGISEREEEGEMDRYRHESPPPYDYQSSIIELGTFETKQGRCIMFPNKYQHKLVKLSNNSDSKEVIRKILCFFIVDPQQKIISTEEVGDQNWEVTSVKVAQQLQAIVFESIGQYLPEPVLQKILVSSKCGFTLEEAEANRLALMQNRKYYKDQMNREIERPVSLCEH